MYLLLALLQDAPPETTNYMIAGYAVIFIVLALYLSSLVLRNRSLKKDLDMLNEVEKGN